jgi:hypothetical protein
VEGKETNPIQYLVVASTDSIISFNFLNKHEALLKIFSTIVLHQLIPINPSRRKKTQIELQSQNKLITTRTFDQLQLG